MKQRDYSFDFCKGVLIFLVVYGHVLQYHLLGNYENNPVYVFIYSFHMPVFFMISGYFARKAVNGDLWSCVITKMKRLVLPATFWCLASLVFYYFAYMKGESITRIFTSALRSTWFLWALFLFFVMASVIWKSKYKYYIAISLSVILWVTHKWQNPYIFDYLHISREWPCFLTGLLYSEYKFAGKQISKKCAFLGWIFALLVYCVEYYRYVNDLGGYETRCVLLLVAGIIFLPIIKISYRYLEHVFPTFSSLVMRIGSLSMGIYLIDSIGKKIIHYTFGTFGATNALYLLPVAILFVCISSVLTISIKKSDILKKYLLGE